MNRQQRRKLQRKKIKQLKQATHQTHKVGWKGDMNQFSNLLDNIPSSEIGSLESAYVCTSTKNRQEFDLALREFGEGIQAEDTKLDVPRLVNICIFKPHPFETSEEMYKVCMTILEKYSPHNVYAIGTGTPPDDIQMDNKQHVYAFVYHIMHTMREIHGEVLAEQLFQKQLEMIELN